GLNHLEFLCSSRPGNPMVNTCEPCSPTTPSVCTGKTCTCSGPQGSSTTCGDTTCASDHVWMCQPSGWQDTQLKCGESPYLYGVHEVHDQSTETLMAQNGRKGWFVYSVNFDVSGANVPFGIDPNAEALARNGYGVIFRLNNGDTRDGKGTLPCPADYPKFAQ